MYETKSPLEKKHPKKYYLTFIHPKTFELFYLKLNAENYKDALEIATCFAPLESAQKAIRWE